MAEEFGQTRSEAATPRRRQDARQQGQVAISGDLTSGVQMLTGVAVLWWGGDSLGRGLLDAMRCDLMALDLPALERPANATSTQPSSEGSSCRWWAEAK